MPALRSMHYASAVGRPHAGSHAAMRYGARHAASETGAPSVATLTIDEYLRLVPTNVPPPPVLALMMSEPYRSILEQQVLPAATTTLITRGPALAAKGLNIPARFLPQSIGPTLEDLLRVVAMLYRQMLADRYAA